MGILTIGLVCRWALRVTVSVAVFLFGMHWGRHHSGGGVATKCDTRPVSVEVVVPCPDGSSIAAPLARIGDELCPARLQQDLLYLHKNDVSKLKENSVLRQVFSQLHHPETPVKAELILKQATQQDFLPLVSQGLPQTKVIPLPPSQPFSQCSSIYLTRSGSRESMPNKCVAVVNVAAQAASSSFHSHRYGTQAKMVDQYVTDWATDKEYTDESILLPLILQRLDSVVAEFLKVMGNPLLPAEPNPSASASSSASGAPPTARRSAFVMVANEGVMDLLLNFICSCQANGISLANLVVFVGQKEYAPLIKNLGAVPFYSPFLGAIPRKAADNYGDAVFSRLMWLKATAVYVAAKAGFNVLFQDADLVWLRDPVPYLTAHVTDIAFMDDGARTTRFTPFFVNSGFYYQKNNAKTAFLMEKMLKSAIEISATHSHQATLTRHLTELHSTFGLDITVLPELLFPSGAQWHNNKKFIKRLTEYSLIKEDPQSEPYVFHMCWTSSRTDKITYLKALGMWHLPYQPAPDSRCEVGKEMLSAAELGVDLRKQCCHLGGYVQHRPAH